MNRFSFDELFVLEAARTGGMLAFVVLALVACDAHAMSIKYSRTISMVFEPTIHALSGEQLSKLQSMSADAARKCHASFDPYILIAAKGMKKEQSTPRTKVISNIFADQGFSREWIYEFGEESGKQHGTQTAVEIEVELVCSPK